MSFISEDKKKLKIRDCIKDALISKDDFIYFKKDNLPFEVFPVDKLFGVLCDIGDNSPITSGISNELVRRVDLSHNTPTASFTDDNQVVYFSPIEYDTKENVLTIIKLFNMLSSTNITIYTSNEIHNYVITFSNENIKFCCYEDPKKISMSTNIIITHGYCARGFIKQKIPTIIIGPYGLGGWVTPENIDYLIRENFKGRPSGTFNEMIPLEILVDEFVEIKEDNNIESILNKNFKLLETYLYNSLSYEIETCVNYYAEIHTQFNDISRRSLLKPKLATNVDIRRNGTTTFIQRKVINDILFSLPESDLQFLKDLNSGLTCENLQEKYKLNSEEFWEIMIPLWERKAIIFLL